MKSQTRWLLALSLTFCVGLTGCCMGIKQPLECPRTMVSLEELVNEYNANAVPVEHLWARAKIEVDVKGTPIGWGSVSSSASPNGTLLFARGANVLGPHDFVLIGREASQDVFRLGSSTADDVYYGWYMLGDRGSGGFFGRNELAGAPNQNDLLIDPHQLLAVLGIVPLPDVGSGDLPAVSLAMQQSRSNGHADPDPCAYVVTYIDRQPLTKKVLFKRQMYFTWGEGQPRQLYRVDFFSSDGRHMMTADLGSYKPVDGLSPTVTMPTDIRLTEVPWPGQENQIKGIHIVLADITAAPKGDPAAAARLFDEAHQLKARVSPDKMTDLDRQVDLPGANQ